MTVTDLASFREGVESARIDSVEEEGEPAHLRPNGYSNYFSLKQAWAIEVTGGLAALCAGLGWETLVIDQARNVKHGEAGAMVLRCVGTHSRDGQVKPVEGFTFIDDMRRFGLHDDQIAAFGAAAFARSQEIGDKTTAFRGVFTDAWQVLKQSPFIASRPETEAPFALVS